MSVYGRNVYGGWSHEGTGPALASSVPANGTQNTGTEVLTYFTITSSEGIDRNLLSVLDGTTPIVLGGEFLGGYDGTITVGEEDCTVVISKYPTWSAGSHTTNIDATDLAGNQADLSYTFNTAAGSTAYDEDVAESVSVSEVMQPQASYAGEPVETVVISDAISPSRNQAEEPSETVAISDALASSKGHVEEPGETVAVSESLEDQQEFTLPAGESVSVSEGLESNQAAGEEPGETVAISDALASSKGQSQESSETVTISDSATAGIVYTTPISESVSVSDASTASHAQSQEESESVPISDFADSNIGTPTELSETVTVSDSADAQQGFEVPASESVPVTDGSSTNQFMQTGVAESVSLSEGATADKGFDTPVSDTVPISDSTEEQQAFSVLLGDAVGISETLVSSEGEDRDLNESVAISDSISATTGTPESISETVGIAESINLSGVYTQDASESVGISDAASLTDLDFGVSETVPLSASLGVLFPPEETFSESLDISDDAEAQRNNEVLVDSVSSTIEGQRFRVALNDELSWSPRGKEASVRSLEIVSTDGGVPAKIVGVTREFDTFQTGNSGYLVYSSHEESASNTFSFPGDVAALSYNPVGKYLEITSGSNQGIFKITGVNSPGSGFTPILLELDTDLPLIDPLNGYVQGRLTYETSTVGPTETVHEFTLDNPRITVGDPLAELSYIERRDGILPGTSALGSSYNTVEITVDNATPWTDPEEANIYVLARISPKVDWKVISGVTNFLIDTTKITSGKTYEISARSLLTTGGAYVDIVGYTLAQETEVQFPRVVWAESIGDEGDVLVEYDQPMQVDSGSLFNPDDYTITGPTTVNVTNVFGYDRTRVALRTTGLGEGDYTLTVSTSTPKDVAGNPLDPTFNTAVFTASPPTAIRSVFTDKGPIAKPPLTIQSGTASTIDSFTEATLTGASLTSDQVGKYLTLTHGTSTNAGTYRISAVTSSTQVRLQASFTIPDTSSFSWEVFDPRDGLLADDPADVTVRVNSVEVTPDAVIGLLGQVVLPSAPSASDDVKIDYSWCCNPKVELRRLNSKEFRLNAYGREQGCPHDINQHKYRYGNVLVTPGDYEPLDPRASLGQPEERELHYRAYERKYTPVFNDPSRLVLNTPIHKIAYPPAQRQLSEEFVAYEGIGLPESLIANSWDRKGSGIATSSGGYLTIEDDSTGAFPTGQPIFWTRNIDLTFPSVFALSWRFRPTTLTELDGVFSGIVAGYSDESVAVVVGFLDDGGTKKIGVLKRAYGDDPSDISAWTGGLDSTSTATGLPAEFDWSDDLHSYRVLRDRTGIVYVYKDGDLDPILQVTEEDVPFLEELDAPFDEIQGVFFGSISRPARSISQWDFVRYLTQPTNPVQTAASSFVSYEANVVPEADTNPWTIVGFHGTSTILSTDFLLLDSTSASDASDVGLVGGDFRGYFRFEPLLSNASEIVFDAKLQGTTYTHGLDPNGLTYAVDDGTKLLQVSFISDAEAPKISYGGRSLPGDFTPYSWSSVGTQSGSMAGRILKITDASTSDGLVYYYDDVAPSASDARVVVAAIDYILEFRCRVNSYTVDGDGFAGAFGQVYDGTRSVGLLLREVSGVKYATFHADGVMLTETAFDWGDGEFHTYRLSKSTSGDLVSLFIDGQFVDSLAYSSFASPGTSTTGQITFGSSTAASVTAQSVVDWAYCNVWRLLSGLRHYVGIWKGTSTGTLQDYHLPVKQSGAGASAVGNALGDPNALFISSGVVSGDMLVVDEGPNAGVYEVASVGSETELTLTSTWPQQPSEVTYRVVEEADWTSQHKWRLTRDPQGVVSVLRDTETTSIIRVGYTSLDLPSSGFGSIRTLSGGLPALVFGSFSSGNLCQSNWDYVRYGLTRSPSELRIVPPHQVLNQWNVMHSPERLTTQLAHTLTDFKSSSTGQPPKTDPDFLEDADLTAFTILNEGTPIVPLTQSFEARAPYPTTEFISALNRPEDVLNSDADFAFNDGAIRYALVVPDDVLYSCLDIIEQSTGEQGLLAPFSDGCGCGVTDMSLEYTKDVCLTYDGDVLPENDTSAPTDWSLVSDDPGQVSTSVFGGVLTFSTGTSGTKTVYRNDTLLPDAPSLRTEAQFRMRVLADGTLGTGDTQIRAGLSAPNLTVALAFVTTPLAERYILVMDLNNGSVLGSITFDYLDGNYHTYHIVRDPGAGVVQVSIS